MHLNELAAHINTYQIHLKGWMWMNACNQAYLLKVLVAVDVLLVMRVLQFVGFDVLPEGLYDTGAGLCVNAQ